ncbi:glycosyltransferase family 9 protein [Rhodoplanes sp. SY1]|uniref:glycosyltransferase family 9 protein n=1 Tax=Rhodoplanes sp. SY1 TaxID=3166646 RepID=UPI0038B4FAB4
MGDTTAPNDTIPAAAADPWTEAMRRGDFAAAWAISDRVLADRRARGETGWHRPRHEQLVWTGAPLAGRHVLVRCYHGLGDTLQFVRFAAPLRTIAAHVTLWVQPAVLPLVATAPGVDAVLPLHDGTPEVDYDLDIEIMELAHALRATPDTLGPVPYLFPERAKQILDRAIVSDHRHGSPVPSPRTRGEGGSPRSGESGEGASPFPREAPSPDIRAGRANVDLSPHAGRGIEPQAGNGIALRAESDIEGRAPLRIGFVWTAGGWDPGRSIPTDLMRRLFQRLATLGIEPCMLQRGLSNSELKSLPARDIGSDDVLITARRMQALDLVVSVDTMPAHLAGALGLPCVTLLKDDCDWRWMTRRDDTPWYPSMRLLRRRADEDWRTVLDRLTAMLIRAVPIGLHGPGNLRSERTLAKRT